MRKFILKINTADKQEKQHYSINLIQLTIKHPHETHDQNSKNFMGIAGDRHNAINDGF